MSTVQVPRQLGPVGQPGLTESIKQAARAYFEGVDRGTLRLGIFHRADSRPAMVARFQAQPPKIAATSKLRPSHSPPGGVFIQRRPIRQRPPASW